MKAEWTVKKILSLPENRKTVLCAKEAHKVKKIGIREEDKGSVFRAKIAEVKNLPDDKQR